MTEGGGVAFNYASALSSRMAVRACLAVCCGGRSFFQLGAALHTHMATMPWLRVCYLEVTSQIS